MLADEKSESHLTGCSLFGDCINSIMALHTNHSKPNCLSKYCRRWLECRDEFAAVKMRPSKSLVHTRFKQHCHLPKSQCHHLLINLQMVWITNQNLKSPSQDVVASYEGTFAIERKSYFQVTRNDAHRVSPIAEMATH